jgi:hypothetical protein
MDKAAAKSTVHGLVGTSRDLPIGEKRVLGRTAYFPKFKATSTRSLPSILLSQFMSQSEFHVALGNEPGHKKSGPQDPKDIATVAMSLPSTTPS